MLLKVNRLNLLRLDTTFNATVDTIGLRDKRAECDTELLNNAEAQVAELAFHADDQEHIKSI